MAVLDICAIATLLHSWSCLSDAYHKHRNVSKTGACNCEFFTTVTSNLVFKCQLVLLPKHILQEVVDYASVLRNNTDIADVNWYQWSCGCVA